MPPQIPHIRSVVVNSVVPAIVPPIVAIGIMMVFCGIAVGVTDSEAIFWWPGVCASWLALFHVPFTAFGPTGYLTELAFLPLLPTLLYLWLVAWVTRMFTSDEDRLQTRIFSAVSFLTPVLIGVVLWGSLYGLSTEVFLQPPNIGILLGLILFVSLVGLLLGLRQRALFLIPSAEDRFPEWGVEGFRLTKRILLTMVVVGAWASLVALIMHWSLVGSVLSFGQSAGGILAFGMLAALYLPNMAIAAGIVLAGGGIHVGSYHVSLYTTHVDQLPAFPLFAALPQHEPSPWWMVLFVIPAVVTVSASARVQGERLGDKVKAVLFGAITTATFAALGAWFAGGSIGVMGDVRMSEALTGGVLAAWIAVLGVVTVLLKGGAGAAAWQERELRKAEKRREMRQAREERAAARAGDAGENYEAADSAADSAADDAADGAVDDAVDDTVEDSGESLTTSAVEDTAENAAGETAAASASPTETIAPSETTELSETTE